MAVTGYLALYVTILGWQQYQNLWSIVMSTGLIYLPFAGIILSATLGPFTSMGAKPACQIALRRLITGVISALLVITFTALPAVHLDPKVLHFTPSCTPNAQQATPGHTGTTYDNAFPVPTNVKVPIFWYVIMAVSNGFTHAASSGLTCAPINYRQVHSELSLAKIQSPTLKKEMTRFYGECYVPAYSNYISGNFSNSKQQQINQILTGYGQDDTSWLGSQVLLTIPGFYSSLQAQSPVEGFAFNPDRDMEEAQAPNHSKWGEPSCGNWWSDANVGLHQKLISALPIGVVQSIMHLGQKTSQLKDAAIRSLITHSFANESWNDFGRGYQSLNNELPSGPITRFLGAPIGTAMHNITFKPKLYLLINALPLIQASLLFAIYTFLAIAIPFSSYRFSFSLTAAIMIFSVIFMSYIWHLVAWFDTYLMQSLYPTLYGLPALGGILKDWLDQPATNTQFTNMIIGTLYVILPFFWLIVMNWCGFAVGHFMSNVMSSMGQPANAAGSEAGNIGSSTIKKGTFLK